MNELEVLESLSSVISIGNASIDAEEMTCKVEEGMVFTPASDRLSQIRYSISTVYALSPNQNLDQISLTVNNHRFPSTGSLTELSEQHPMSITISGESVVLQRYVPWHIQEDQVSFTLELIPDEDDEISPQQILNSPVFIGFILVGILCVGFAIQWIYNQYTNSEYDISLEDDDDDIDEEWSNLDEDDIEDDLKGPDIDEEVAPPPRRTTQQRERPKSKRVRVEKKQPNEAEKLLNEASSEVVRKRRARRTAEQPTRTKRRKLSDSSPSESTTRKRRVVKKEQDRDQEMDDTLKRFVSDSPKE